MQCKKCQTELENDCTVCPNCGEKYSETQSNLKFWRIAFAVSAVTVSLALLVLLAGLVHYGVTGSFLPKKNDIFNKNSYSFSAEKLETQSGNKSFLGKMDKVVATMGEHQLTNRELQLYYWQLVRSSSYTDMSSSEPLDEQIQDPETGLTWQQYFLQTAIENWAKDMIVCERAQKAGFQMPEDYAVLFDTLETDLANNATSEGYTSTAAMLQDNFGPGCDYETYRTYLWNYWYSGLYLNHLAETLEVSEAEIEAYFVENEAALASSYTISITKDSGRLVDVRHILILPEEIAEEASDEASEDTAGEDEEEFTEEQWEACRLEAEKILAEYLAGEATEDAFGALAAEYTEDAYSASAGGLYEYVYPGQMVEPFEDWCFDENRKPGDTGLVRTDYGYHIMYFVYGDEGWIRLCADGARAQKVQTLQNSWLAENPVTVNYRNIVLAELELSASA